MVRRSGYRWVIRLSATLMPLLAAAQQVRGQEWSWPERAENLQELPADFPPERLRAVMRGFSQALGVRCAYCHVGDEGAPLSTYDFASDGNPNKDRARAMYRLLGVVNEELSNFESSGARVNMWCHTCHVGRPRPQTLEEAVDERYEAEGGEAAYELFVALRGRYFGAGGYDFTPGTVDGIARSLEARGDTATAVRFVRHNAISFPRDPLTLERMGDVWVTRGGPEQALSYYRRSLQARFDQRVADKIRDLSGGR